MRDGKTLKNQKGIIKMKKITDWKGNTYNSWEEYAKVYGKDAAEAARKNAEWVEMQNAKYLASTTPEERRIKALIELENKDHWTMEDYEKYNRLTA